MRRYPSYKNSGVDWLGDVPAHWKTKRADGFLAYGKKQARSDWFRNFDVFHYSIPLIQDIGTGAYESGSNIDSDKLLLDGDEILVSKLNPRKGCVLLAERHDVPTICSTEFVPLKAKKCNRKFAFYLYFSHLTRCRISAVVQSVTKSHQRARPMNITKIWHALPPDVEQQAIVSFLDHETAVIDELIAKKERVIELLREKRTAIISHAVTKGLNPDAKMKDSSIDWLGEIPEHWEVIRFKYRVLLQRGFDLPVESFEESTFPVYGSNGIIGYHNNYTTKGPSIVVGRSGSVGEVTFVPEDFWAHNTALYVKQFNLTCPKFAFYFMKALDLKWLSAGSAVGTLNRNYIHNIFISTPSLDEQQAIADFLDHETSKIDALIAKLTEAIEKLKEYHTALISAAVTGKIDVRGKNDLRIIQYESHSKN